MIHPCSSVARLYFSAHWCRPCRTFTPYLAEAYNAHIQYLNGRPETKRTELDAEEKNEEIEVIFISLDSVVSEFESYRSTMPWHSIPHSNLWRLNIKDDLSQKYGVRSIPTLIVLDGESGDVVTRNGKGCYSTYFKGDYQPPLSMCNIS